MKIAIASADKGVDSQVSDEGGRAPYYLIFDDFKLIETWENPMRTGGGGAGYGVANILAEKDVEKVIVGKIGGNMREALEEKNIEFLERMNVLVQEVLVEMLK